MTLTPKPIPTLRSLLRQASHLRWAALGVFGAWLCFCFARAWCSALVVLTVSMEPTLRRGDLLLLKHCNAAEVQVGDIVAF